MKSVNKSTFNAPAAQAGPKGWPGALLDHLHLSKTQTQRNDEVSHTNSSYKNMLANSL